MGFWVRDNLNKKDSESNDKSEPHRYRFGIHSSTHEMEANEASSPPIFNSPFSPRSPPNTHYPRGYAPIARSEPQRSHSSGGYRNPSIDSTLPLQHNPNAGYFDLPLQSDHRDSVITVAARRPSQHGRNWSNPSNQSAVSQNSQNSAPTPIAELDAGRYGDRRSNLQRTLQGFGMGIIMSRRRSDSVVLTGGPVRHDYDGDCSFNPSAPDFYSLRKEKEECPAELPANSIGKPTCPKPLGKFATVKGNCCRDSVKLLSIKDDEPNHPQEITLKRPKLTVIIPKLSQKGKDMPSGARYSRKRSPSPMPKTGEGGDTQCTPSITRGSPLSQAAPAKTKIMPKVLYDFKDININELVIKDGGVIEIIRKDSKGESNQANNEEQQ
jgi:hypothetical protein